MPLLLEFGDSYAREFVVRIASQVGWPTVYAAVRKFALGRRGSDDLRFQAAMTLVEADQMPPGPVRMWREGEIHELLLTAYEITPEPTDPLPKDVEELSDRVRTALQERDGATAESLLTDALRLHPDHPGLAYNRATAIALQGREDEALAIVREVHARQPDYLFARVRLAEDAVAVPATSMRRRTCSTRSCRAGASTIASSERFATPRLRSCRPRARPKERDLGWIFGGKFNQTTRALRCGSAGSANGAYWPRCFAATSGDCADRSSPLQDLFRN